MSWGMEASRALVGAFRDGWVDHPLPIAAATVDPGGASTAGDVDLLFEIGSVTKTMTATLLALRVLAGDAALDDPIGRWLDAGPNATITLGQLATHTAGLPRLAPTFRDGDGFRMDDPYACFTHELAELGLRQSELSGVGDHAYSNFGYQLLGIALERIADLPFGALLTRDIFEPLAMKTARITGTDGAQAQGHHSGRPVPHWHDILPGPGGVEASAHDMAAYAAAVLSPPSTPLGAAIGHVTTAHAPGHGLGWAITGEGVLWHNGGTGGFHAMLAVDRAQGRAAVAMVGSGDLDALDGAVLVALGGGDPSSLRPEPVGPEWSERALEVLPLLISQDWDGLRERMTPSMRETLTVDLLSSAWTQVMGARGEVSGAVVASSTGTASAITVQIDLAFSAASGTVTMTFARDLALAGLWIT